MGNESIRELEMVTADGSILEFREKRRKKNTTGYLDYYRDQVQVRRDGVEVTGKQYSDLWDAMRVAGSSFGVVTSFTFQIFKGHEPPVFFLLIRLSEEDQLGKFSMVSQPIRYFWLIGSSSIYV